MIKMHNIYPCRLHKTKYHAFRHLLLCLEGEFKEGFHLLEPEVCSPPDLARLVS